MTVYTQPSRESVDYILKLYTHVGDIHLTRQVVVIISIWCLLAQTLPCSYPTIKGTNRLYSEVLYSCECGSLKQAAGGGEYIQLVFIS